MSRLKTAIVTGGSSGIGYAVAQRLLQEGYLVFIVSRSAADCDLVDGKNCFGYNIDLSNVDMIRSLIDSIHADVNFDRIDVLVNCAGVGYGTPLAALSEEQYDAIMDPNVKGMFFMTQAVVPFMKAAAVICNVSSIAGTRGFTEWTTYCASKYAVEGFSKALRAEVRDRGIKVMVVRPGAVNTPLYHFLKEEDKRDFIRPETVAAVICQNLFMEENAVMEEVFINNAIGDI